jgi:hypothetical protein
MEKLSEAGKLFNLIFSNGSGGCKIVENSTSRNCSEKMPHIRSLRYLFI